jgi:hypothetical protein
MDLTDKEVFSLNFINQSSEAAGYPLRAQGADPYHNLIEYISWLMEYRMDFLLSLLYRLDVTEQAIKGAIHPGNTMPPAEAIANLILERQLERLETKRKYSKPTDAEGLEGMDW